MKPILLALILCFAKPAGAGIQLVPRYGFERNLVTQGLGGSERQFALEVLCPIGQAMLVKSEVGFWASRQQPERKSMVFSSVAWGYRVALDWGPYAEAFVGPGYISETDTQNGSHFEIFHQLGFGWMRNGWGIGGGWEHISNAGLFPGPNRGRDFWLAARFHIPIGGK